MLSTRYKDGLHWIISGDVNELKLDAVLNLQSNFHQVVTFKTRPKSTAKYIHDPIITSLSKYYQNPIGLSPLKSDIGLTESDHLMVFMAPLQSIDNIPARKTHLVKIRPCPKSGVQKLVECMENENWSFIISEKSAHIQAKLLHGYLMSILDNYLPEKCV